MSYRPLNKLVLIFLQIAQFYLNLDLIPVESSVIFQHFCLFYIKQKLQQQHFLPIAVYEKSDQVKCLPMGDYAGKCHLSVCACKRDGP